MRRIVAEDALDAHARAAKRAETQAYIAAFLVQQQSIRCLAGPPARVLVMIRHGPWRHVHQHVCTPGRRHVL